MLGSQASPVRVVRAERGSSFKVLSAAWTAASSATR